MHKKFIYFFLILQCVTCFSSDTFHEFLQLCQNNKLDVTSLRDVSSQERQKLLALGLEMCQNLSEQDRNYSSNGDCSRFRSDDCRFDRLSDYNLYVVTKSNKKDSTVVAAVATQRDSIQSKTCNINSFVVDQQERGTGLAQEFMESTLDHLQQDGYEKVSLVCYNENKRAHRFYEKMGFKKIGGDGMSSVLSKVLDDDFDGTIECDENCINLKSKIKQRYRELTSTTQIDLQDAKEVEENNLTHGEFQALRNAGNQVLIGSNDASEQSNGQLFVRFNVDDNQTSFPTLQTSLRDRMSRIDRDSGEMAFNNSRCSISDRIANCTIDLRQRKEREQCDSFLSSNFSATNLLAATFRTQLLAVAGRDSSTLSLDEVRARLGN